MFNDTASCLLVLYYLCLFTCYQPMSSVCRLYLCCCVSLCIIIKNTGAESVGYKGHDRKGRGAESVGYIMWQVAAAKFIFLSPWMNYFSEVYSFWLGFI